MECDRFDGDHNELSWLAVAATEISEMAWDHVQEELEERMESEMHKICEASTVYSSHKV